MNKIDRDDFPFKVSTPESSETLQSFVYNLHEKIVTLLVGVNDERGNFLGNGRECAVLNWNASTRTLMIDVNFTKGPNVIEVTPKDQFSSRVNVVTKNSVEGLVFEGFGDCCTFTVGNNTTIHCGESCVLYVGSDCEIIAGAYCTIDGQTCNTISASSPAFINVGEFSNIKVEKRSSSPDTRSHIKCSDGCEIEVEHAVVECGEGSKVKAIDYSIIFAKSEVEFCCDTTTTLITGNHVVTGSKLKHHKLSPIRKLSTFNLKHEDGRPVVEYVQKKRTQIT